MHFVSDAIEQYAHDHTRAPGTLFEELREATHAQTQNPQMQVGRVEGALLRNLVGLIGARRVLEIGTFTGYSALCMAEALPADGTLVTCDRDEAVVAIARAFFARSPHGHKIEIRLGDALETIRALGQDASFDLAFVDADKARYVEYYELILPRLREGGLLVADNTLWSGRVLDPKSDDDHGVVRFNAHVSADARVDHVLLTVRDGVMLVRKL